MLNETIKLKVSINLLCAHNQPLKKYEPYSDKEK